MRLKITKLIMIISLMLAPSVMYAPPVPPGPGGTTPAAPIDAGIGFLLAAGAAYGVSRLAKPDKA